MTDDEIVTLVRTRGPEVWTGSSETDRSTADLRLMRVLFILTTDPQQMDRVFRQSPLMRDKYENHPGYRFALLSAAGVPPAVT